MAADGNGLPDIEVDTLTRGCLTSCGTFAGAFVVVLLLGSIAGIDLAHTSPQSAPRWLPFVGFLLTLGGYFLTGYVTARYARRAPIFHVLILGIVFMLIGLLGFVLPDRPSLGETRSSSDPLLIFSWLLTLPMMLWGAVRAALKNENDE